MLDKDTPRTPRSADVAEDASDLRDLPKEERVALRFEMVRLFARYWQPVQIVKYMQSEHGVSITRQAVSRYSPECCPKGQEPPSAYWDYFREQRAKYNEELEARPMYSMAYRLDALDEAYRDAAKKGLWKTAIAAVVEAEKIVNPRAPQRFGGSVEVEQGEGEADGPVRIRMNLFEEVPDRNGGDG
jgi:hypothetical protein